LKWENVQDIDDDKFKVYQKHVLSNTATSFMKNAIAKHIFKKRLGILPQALKDSLSEADWKVIYNYQLFNQKARSTFFNVVHEIYGKGDEEFFSKVQRFKFLEYVPVQSLVCLQMKEVCKILGFRNTIDRKTVVTKEHIMRNMDKLKKIIQEVCVLLKLRDRSKQDDTFQHISRRLQFVFKSWSGYVFEKENVDNLRCERYLLRIPIKDDDADIEYFKSVSKILYFYAMY